MIDSSVTYVLHRVHRDGTTEPIEGTETTDRIEGIHHGHRLSREEPGSAFTLYEGGTPRDKFGHRRLALRLKVEAVAMMAG